MLENIKLVVAIVLALSFGYVIGHWKGAGDGKTLELAAHNVAATKEAVEATHDREVIDDTVRKLPKTAIDSELSVNGWLRD